jgi:N-acetylmuramoyl-L-alanine amidase CwlA
MEVKKNLVSALKYPIKCPYTMKPEFYVVHNTANDAPASNEIAYMIRNNNKVSFHYAIDDKEIIQGIPENRNSWNAGDGGSGQGNRKGIAIEICYSKSGGDRFTKAEQNAAKFIAAGLKEKGWGIDRVKKHNDFSKKNCPHRTLELGWQRFLNMIKAELNEKPTTTPAAPAVEYYPKYNGNSKSIVDALKSLGIDSSKTHRKQIAAKNGLKITTLMTEANTQMLVLLKQGKLIKP